MAYSPHVRVTCSGTMGTAAVPPEIFSFGWALAPDGDFSEGAIPSETCLTAMNAAVVAMFANAASQISNLAKLTRIKYAKIGVDGKYSQIPVEYVVSQVGGSALTPHPPQVAYAVTLDGPDAIKRVTGRYYLPMTTLTVQGDSLSASTTQRNALLATQVTMMNAISAALVLDEENPDDVLELSIASQGRLPDIAPFNPTVVALRAGLVMDTQRRRRNALPEDYARTLLG